VADDVKKVLVAPNEDGAGPSALVSHVVRHLLARARGFRLEIAVWNRSRHAFNRVLYGDLPAVRVAPVWNIVELVKDPATGEVSATGTLERLREYERLREGYPGPGPEEEAGFDLVLDFGMPPAVRWGPCARTRRGWSGSSCSPRS